MQALTNDNCPIRGARAYDARNNQYYYVRKIPNTGVGGVGDLCWMHSNLRYAGDGNWNVAWGWSDDRYATSATNTTSSTDDDVRPLTLVYGKDISFVSAQYADPIIGDIGSTNYQNIDAEAGFYGYLYNWCTAMDGQADACSEYEEPRPSTAISICPAGWRLPVGGGEGEFAALNNAVNHGSVISDRGLRTYSLAVYAGARDNNSGEYGQGSYARLWSSTVAPPVEPYLPAAYFLRHSSDYVDPAYRYTRSVGYAIRCVR